MLNKDFFKRASTYANIGMCVASQILAGLGAFGLEPQAFQAWTLALGIFIGLCQLIKKEAK